MKLPWYDIALGLAWFVALGTICVRYGFDFNSNNFALGGYLISLVLDSIYIWRQRGEFKNNLGFTVAPLALAVVCVIGIYFVFARAG